ncbi:uncharacterized protein DS421_2g49780 [Arachis hypogaea]|nr:uncharacterized protein DS421_2g49780 [Arachis hypogaea]
MVGCYMMNKKIVFIVDPRPIGYELNKSLHVVRAICDDIDIVRFLEDSTHDNQQQKFPIDPFVPHFPFEFKNPVEFHSNASIQCSSSSSAPTVNHDFHARISSSQGSNLVGNNQPLTIKEELRRAFGQCENTDNTVERMDEYSDRKSKKSLVVPAEQKEKHKPDLNKTKNMSYCGNSHSGDGAELILIRSPLSDTSLLTLYGIPAKIESDRKRTKSPVVLVE